MMDGIADFNRSLNSSTDFSSQYDAWADYRAAVTDFAMNALENRKTCLVVGAGNCNDLDLKELAGKTTLTLSDVDREAMMRGMKKQGLDLEMVQVDYLDLEDSDLILRIKALLPVYNQEVFGLLLDAIKNRVAASVENIWAGRKFDCIIVLPIHTQLLYRTVENLLHYGMITELLSEEQFSTAQRMLLDIMPEILNHFNEALTDQLDVGGTLILFSDVLEDSASGHYTKAFRQNNFDSAYNEYLQNYGMGLGHYGIYELSQRMSPVQESWFLWPFDEDRFLFVKGQVLKK